MSNENIKVNKIMNRLQDLEREQLKISQSMNKLDETENDFFEIDKQGTRLFDRLYHTWMADGELNLVINDSRVEMEHYKRRIISEMEQNREQLIEEKKRLYRKEEDLYTLKRNIIQEEIE